MDYNFRQRFLSKCKNCARQNYLTSLNFECFLISLSLFYNILFLWDFVRQKKLLKSTLSNEYVLIIVCVCSCHTKYFSIPFHLNLFSLFLSLSFFLSLSLSLSFSLFLSLFFSISLYPSLSIFLYLSVSLSLSKSLFLYFLCPKILSPYSYLPRAFVNSSTGRSTLFPGLIFLLNITCTKSALSCLKLVAHFSMFS